MPTVTLRVRRADPARGGAPYEEVYHVPFREGMTLLDALTWVREEVDSSLAIRFSCRTANACKECAAQIDGKVGYMCTFRLAPGRPPVSVAPLPGKELIRDLVVRL